MAKELQLMLGEEAIVHNQSYLSGETETAQELGN